MPFALIAAANTAIAAAKAGCKLYKDIKNAAGDVREVLDDLKSQFSKIQNPTKPLLFFLTNPLCVRQDHIQF
jgi:hypothetical protein